ncbi:hypothetical protein U27_05124 [Candidatus Vecturithrix granuli]|uniref:Uncharacterized protein n=1 Tax=Vecturithrix granuli TaxID=1499967 RepID=A0A081C0P6_VECG1|nr:hypothetical protein U27_05124 [Candidatus Vecturithrix granuli]
MPNDEREQRPEWAGEEIGLLFCRVRLRPLFGVHYVRSLDGRFRRGNKDEKRET